MTAAPPPALRRNPSLTELFNHFVNEAEQNFPQLRGSLVLYDARRKKQYLSQNFNMASKRFRKGDSLKAFISRNVRGDLKKFAGFAMRNKKPNFSLIVINEKVPNQHIPSVEEKTLHSLQMVFDHEVGHLVIPEAFDEKDISAHGSLAQENMAEAFAQLMHYKRYGIDTAVGSGGHMLRLGESFAFKHKRSDLKSHYYYPAIMKIVAARDTIDFSALTAADLAQLARRFAVTYTLSDAQIRDLDEAFIATRRAYKHRGRPAAMRALAQIAETTPHPHVARICISLFSDLCEKYAAQFKGEEWQALQKRLLTLGERIKEEDILFGVARTSQGLKPAA